jgi:hypothetical protein
LPNAKDKSEIDADDVARLLDEVGVPVDVPSEQLYRLAELLRQIPGLIKDRAWLVERLRARTVYDRAQAAIDELRCAVPSIIEWEMKIGNFCGDESYLANAEALKNWLLDMPDFLTMPGSPSDQIGFASEPWAFSETKMWQGHAVLNRRTVRHIARRSSRPLY